MKPITYAFILSSLWLMTSCSGDDNGSEIPVPDDETIYFPPLATDVWETTSISELNWNENQLQPLLEYLAEKNSKGFIILHNGKIVVEAYFNGHTATTPWYWASAGKTLTTAITGIAQDEGLIDINNKVSQYLGTGWTSAPLDKENLITCKNLLSMTSGLDDSLGNDTSAANLQYKADAGERWAYHNVFEKLQDVIALTSGDNWSDYFNVKLKNRIGMSGAWIQNGDFHLYWSNTRSMARFGLLTYADGKWDGEQIIPEAYLNDAVNTSQSINEAYGYMWWLNGKSSYHLPQSQFEFPGSLIPEAPSDMYAGLGKNDQKLYVVPSKKLVVVRMGETGDGENFALSNFDNDLWNRINALIN